MKRMLTGGLFSLALAALFLSYMACGQEKAQPETKNAQPVGPEVQPTKPAVEKTPDGLVRLSKKHDVWLDTKRKAVLIDGKICVRDGYLEMLACPKGTKEHESIIAVNCLPEEVHAGLLALGAKQGTPVKYATEETKYAPATGEIIDIYILWKDADGTSKEVRAQEFIRHAKDRSPMKHEWVFAGSGIHRDDQTGRPIYQANGGDFICVSNFPTATLDLPVESSQATGGLLFEANTDAIPPKDTPVRMVLVPRFKKAEVKPAKEEAK